MQPACHESGTTGLVAATHWLLEAFDFANLKGQEITPMEMLEVLQEKL
jgi:hypothetical protein